jgi:zinc protease
MSDGVFQCEEEKAPPHTPTGPHCNFSGRETEKSARSGLRTRKRIYSILTSVFLGSLALNGINGMGEPAQSEKPSTTKEKSEGSLSQPMTNQMLEKKGNSVHTYRVKKYPTGLELVSLQSSKVPLITIVLVVKAGAMTETPDIRGLTHLWEHMFFKGNQRIPNQELFNKRIRQLGIVYNGDTSPEMVRYYFTLPSAFLDEGLQFMADAISTPLLDQKELERERVVVLDEYDRSAARPGFDFNNLQRVLFYGAQEHLRDPLGLRPVITNATREQLLRIKKEVFVPSNSAIVVAGDFDQNQLEKSIEKHFGDWKNPSDWKPITPAPFPQVKENFNFVMSRPQVQNAYVELTFVGPKARSMPQESFAVDVLSHLLALKSGKFYKKFVDSGLIFQGGLSYYTQSQAGEINLYASTNPDLANRVATQLTDEIKEWIKPDYFTNEQLDDVRRSLSINHMRQVNQTSEYAKNLAFWWAVTGLDYYSEYLNNLQKVTLKDVQDFVKKWLIGTPKMVSTLVSPEDAQKAGLVDNSKPLVDQYLKHYQTAPNPAVQDQGKDSKASAKGASL